MVSKLNKRTKTILTCLLILVAITFLLLIDLGVIKGGSLVTVIRLSSIYALIGVSMNLVNGFTGLFSLGQAGFMAIGAYVVAMFTIPISRRPIVYYLVQISPTIENVVLPFWTALILGGIAAAIFAAIIGAPVLRLKSDYLAIATLGFSEIIRAIIANEQLAPFTNGSFGLKNIPGFSSIFIPVGISALCIGIIVLIINSSYGRAFKAIREDEIAAEAMGINLFKHKQLSFVIGAFFSAIGGGLLAAHLTAIDSNQFKIAVTYELLLIVVLGGMGSVTGTCISAFIVSAGKELLRFFDEPHMIGSWNIPIFKPGFRMVIFSILLMAIVLFYSKGLMGNREFSWDGILGKLRKTFRRRKRKGVS